MQMAKGPGARVEPDPWPLDLLGTVRCRKSQPIVSISVGDRACRLTRRGE